MALERDKLGILKKVWGYKAFRSQQEEVIDRILDGKDTLVIMPTGGGKSLCFQLPALLMPGLTVVISPLIALMDDQVAALRSSGVPVAAMHSNIAQKECQSIEQNIYQGNVKILYVSPERATTSGFVQMLDRIDISLIAVDEAHCVSVWGNDFRPDYTKINIIRDRFDQVPFVALTATADSATQQDICNQLHLKTPQIFISSFERHNIYVEGRPAENRLKQIFEFLSAHPRQSGIIYCLSRRDTESLAQKLASKGFKCHYYHAGMTAQDRQLVQQNFQNDKVQFICATIAFGMGIDKGNIRWVIHYSMPKNLEGYYQEIGRAGRDGSPAKALLFYSWADLLKLRRFIDESDANETFKTVQHAKLDRMWEYASAYECRTNVVLNYFGEYRTHLCGHCDNCTLPPKKIDGTIIAQKALSAIRRCDENIGLNLLIDILRGSFKSEVKKGNYDKIKTFGAGKDISYIHWKIYLTQLINQGLIRIDYTDQFKLKTTPLSHDILFGDNAIQLVNVDIPTTTASQIQKPISKKMDFKVVLVQRLKKWREEEADKRQVPSYTLITDTTLEILGDKKPIFKSDLHEISGMGEVKIQQFGQAILTVIRQMYLSEEFTKLKAGKSIIETAQMLYEGLTPEEIAHKKGVTTNTIWTHIVELIRHDEDIDIHIYVSKEEVNIVHKAWEVSNKATTMSEIIACMSEPMAYHKVRLAMTYIFKSQNN